MVDAVIISGVRTAIGNFGGTLRDIPAVRLGSIVIKEAVKKAGLRPQRDPEVLSYAPKVFRDIGLIELEEKYYDWENDLVETKIDEVIMGNVIQAGQGQNVARQSLIQAGIPKEVTAYTVNKACASGMKAVALASQAIKVGDAEVIIAGGMENMSAAPYYAPKARWGARMFNTEMIDGLVYDGLWETFYDCHMGMTAENIAWKYGITRREQDELALMSHQRALAAISNGILRQEIVPVEVKKRGETKLFDTDEHPRETSMEALATRPPAFKPDGSVTGANSSGLTDAAAALVIMSSRKADELGLEPMAMIRSYAAYGIDPAYMGLGAIPAIKKALKLAGLSLDDIAVVELVEAFAAQTIAVARELRLDMDKTNPHGSGISLGHPIGCTGARVLVTLIHEMMRRNLRFGLAGLCMGGGQGMAMILERK